MILLDTNILSEPMRPSPDKRVISWLDQQIITDLFICAITKAEIELGIALLPESRKKQSLFAAAQEVFSHFSDRCLAFGATEASIYAELIEVTAQSRTPDHISHVHTDHRSRWKLFFWCSPANTLITNKHRQIRKF